MDSNPLVYVPEELSDAPPAYSSDGVDVTLIRWMLSLTPTERLACLQDFVDTCARLRSGIRDD